LDGLLICLALSHIRSELGCTESLIVFAELEHGVGLGAAEHIGICNIDFNWLQGPSPLYRSLSEAPLNSCLNLISTLSGLVRSSSIASSSFTRPFRLFESRPTQSAPAKMEISLGIRFHMPASSLHQLQPHFAHLPEPPSNILPVPAHASRAFTSIPGSTLWRSGNIHACTMIPL
jgi:hypothetical protein